MATVERRSSDHSGFRDWRAARPFWGGLLLIVASLLIAWVPLQFAFELMLIGGAFTVIGLVFALLVFLSGVAAILKPDLATLAGIAGIGFSILSLVGALGGLLIGALLGLAGGSLCIAWEAPDAADRRDEPAETTTSTTGADFEWQEDPTADRSTASGFGESAGTDSDESPGTAIDDTGTGPDFEWQEDPDASSDRDTGTAGGSWGGSAADAEEPETSTSDVTDDESDTSEGGYEPETFEIEDTADDEPTFSWQEDPYAEEENDES